MALVEHIFEQFIYFLNHIELPPQPDHLPIFEDQLLDGLQAWLDRLFEGSTYRYHINYWPEFPISPSNFAQRS